MPFPRRRVLVFQMISLLVCVYAALLFGLWLTQRQFIYFPHRGGEAEFLALARPKNVQPWRDERGELIGWKRGSGASNRLLIFHGNGGHALLRTH